MRDDQWRKDAALVKLARKFLDDPEFRTLLDVLDNSHPVRNMLIGRFAIEDRAMFQARCEGFELAIQTLKSLGVFEQEKEEVEETYTDEYGANVPIRKKLPRLRFGQIPDLEMP